MPLVKHELSLPRTSYVACAFFINSCVRCLRFVFTNCGSDPTTQTIMSTEKQVSIKEAIIAHLLKEKEASYKNMMAMQESEVAGAEKASENGDGQFQGGKTGQALNRVEARASVVEALQHDINILGGLSSIEPTDEIQLGDVIETDKGNFFVAVPADEFNVGGKSYRGISTESPLFGALKGKKDGDEVTVNENNFELISSF